MKVLSSVYGAAASWRRRWYASEPSRQHRLSRPVISVGNLRVGGAGKTPVVAHLCELLLSLGEKPAILSRGYGRTRPAEGVTIVSDGREILADVASAGDEPLMLARLLPTVPVLVGADRFQCGQRAEHALDITVHVLDDGFQHLALARDVDLLLVDEHDLSDAVLPAGRLREPLTNAVAAHALLVSSDNAGTVAHVAHTLGVSEAYHVLRAIHQPRPLDSKVGPHTATDHAIAFAGIARPDRFFSDLTASGRAPMDAIAFPDHHPYTQKDVDRIVATAQRVHTTIALTTEKDAVRLEGLDFREVHVHAIPLSVTIEPSQQFRHWLVQRLATAHSTSGVSKTAPAAANASDPHPREP